MADVEYGVYQNDGQTDGTAVATETIDDSLRDDEFAMRISQLFDRAVDGTSRTADTNWVVKPTAEVV